MKLVFTYIHCYLEMINECETHEMYLSIFCFSSGMNTWSILVLYKTVDY